MRVEDTTGHNWSGQSQDGTTHDPYYKFVFCRVVILVVVVVAVVVVIVIVTVVVVVFWVEDTTGQAGVRMERHMTRTTNLFTVVESFFEQCSLVHFLRTFLSMIRGILGLQNLYGLVV